MEWINHFRIVVPGVASFGAAMRTLKEKRFDILLNDFVVNKKPILGLCVGCQILFGSSSEFGSHKGLNYIKGDVQKLPNEKYKGAKLPNVGWFRVKLHFDNNLFSSVDPSEYFYFTHSFHCITENKNNILASYSFHNEEVVAAVIKNNIIGLQFHPEMSSYAGKVILKNFLKL